jgi:hypothetical protein
VAGSAFAEVSWGGNVVVGANLAHGNNGDDDAMAGALVSEVNLYATGRAETPMGIFGARGNVIGRIGGNRLDVENLSIGPSLWGHAWWRPNDIVYIGLGNDVNFFGRQGRLGFVNSGGAHVTRELHQRRPEVGRPAVVNPHQPFMTDRFNSGFAVEFTPLGDMLYLSFGIPFGWVDTLNANRDAEDVYSEFNAQVFVRLDGIGNLGFAYMGSSADNNNGSLFAYFRLTMLPLLDIDFGARFNLVDEEEMLYFGVGTNIALTSDLGLRFRGTVGLGLNHADSLNETRMNFEVLPFVRVGDLLFGVIGGLGMNMAGSDNGADTLVSWLVNPYMSANVGGNRFNAGFRVFGDNDRGGDSFMGWEVPVGITFIF